jgi:hypothetical protein
MEDTIQKHGGHDTDEIPAVLDCDQVGAELKELVQTPHKFGQQYRRAYTAQLIAHLAACDRCVLALGEAVVARRTRNTLDARLRRCLPLVSQMYIAYMKGNKSWQN